METTELKHVVLVPYPFQGHITPMLQLGSILHAKGFSITIAHTKFNSPNPSNQPKFTFLPLSDNLDGYDTSFYNILNAISVMNKNCESSFEEYIVGMKGKVGCIIYDSIMKFVDVVANKLKLPTIVLRTTTAAYMQSHIVMFQLVAQKLIPLPDSQLQALVPKMYPLRFKDLPLSASEEIPKSVLEFVVSYMDIKSSSAVIWNTVETLDHCPLQQLQQHLQVPFFPIGPFHKMAPPLMPTTSLMEEDISCLSWLDKQAPNSVVYVSLGSMAIIDENELIEMARGLAKSEQPFLWVIRPSLLNNGSDDAITSLPEHLIQEKGLVVKWAPQKKVLAHSAVGGFFDPLWMEFDDLESLCEGVPMICRPSFADQMVNARYLTHVWKVGLELENVDEKSVERGIRTVMVGEQGMEMRQRAIEMKQEVERSLIRGGSSTTHLTVLLLVLGSCCSTSLEFGGSFRGGGGFYRGK
ncbi:hypothetical protein DH2020_044141 [Rehmannia glutinosa]|uniref:UDP-glycosyltransferase n=1 Tax=Rehmannia glutinosa TaxID=99300 RepID=A0ABR0UIL6_REHGL